MDVIQGIKTRRSVVKVKQDPIEREKVEALLELATHAPNHHLTEPWRFFVMEGEARKILSDAYQAVAIDNVGEDLTEETKELIAKTQVNKATRAPVVIAVVVSFRGQDDTERKEDRAATHAAIENMLLGAHAMGLGAIWRSGAPMYHPKMKEAFKLSDNEEMVGLVYLGYPDIIPVPKNRKPVSEVTTWL
ncbi:nitroreductase [Aquibacillus sp. 3ASR75-54]|uniref:Putative NAD(P)H nitroreductase n=2 Tax=Aquibacillus salsiterrae TaxID=2950439 RepID=A0A9X4AFF9_9BACI|nr:nitroreductase [Aquibacillus salsiterrae]MDC3417624.1 nitroreductase [Aquibacillus salsiterrae]